MEQLSGLKKEITMDNLDNSSSDNCLICKGKSKKKDTLINTETKEKRVYFWDICEDCKKIENCFTCHYSKIWYLRYKGHCDINFNYFIFLSILGDDNDIPKTTEEKERFWNFLASFGIEESSISKETIMEELLITLKSKMKSSIEIQLPDCRVFKNKNIGKTIYAFWIHTKCGRYKKGDASKEEYDDYQADHLD